MSFTTDVKNELCGFDLSHKEEKIVMYGFLYCLKEQMEYFTESEAVKDYIKRLAGDTRIYAEPIQRRGRDGFLLKLNSLDFNINNFEISSDYVDGRDENTGLFLRGAFLACGIAANPDKEYHLEFSVGAKEKSDRLCRLINESGMNVRESCRKGKYILYTKDSEGISDILTFIGAMISSMEIMNAKIFKGVRNNVNRAVNCESANIEKTVAASRKQVEDIEYIAKNKGLYYDALEECQKGWHEGNEDISPFIKYLLSTILAAYRDFEERVSLILAKLPAVEMVRRAAYGKIGKFTKNDIMELCPSIGKTSIENALKNLVENGALNRHGKGKSTFYTRSDAE